MEQYIQSVINNHNLWKYYEQGPEQPNINDVNSCFHFIGDYFRRAQKYSKEVEDGLDCLLQHDPNRLRHIVSTFFLGLALYHDQNLSFRKCISSQICRFRIFRNVEQGELDRQFTYIWFMITLFHDLGYLYEKDFKQFSEERYLHDIPFCNSVPRRYRDIIEPYQIYRQNKDHGICAGMILDKVLCETRASRCYLYKDPLNWDPLLDEVYHHVAWIIMSHNIWWKRDTDPERNLHEYHIAGLDSLVLSSSKLRSGVYNWYPIRYCFHPLFFLFCLVDSIEPIKRLQTLRGIKFQTERNRIKISIESVLDNYTDYLRKDVAGMNDWLLHIIYSPTDQYASMHIPTFHSWLQRMKLYRR